MPAVRLPRSLSAHRTPTITSGWPKKLKLEGEGTDDRMPRSRLDRDFRRAGFRWSRGPYAHDRLRPARDPAAGSVRLRPGGRPQRALARQPVTIAASRGLGDDSDISSGEPERVQAGER